MSNKLEIKTKDFTLRPLKMSDTESIAKNVSSKRIYKNTLRIPRPYKVKYAEEWIKRSISNYKKKKPDSFIFGIEIDNEIVGAVGLHDIIHEHKSRIGYWLGDNYCGKGIMTKAVKKVVSFAFKEFKLKRIQAEVFLFNPASARVLEKNGFVLECIAKKGAKKKNKFLDEKIYGLVK